MRRFILLVLILILLCGLSGCCYKRSDESLKRYLKSGREIDTMALSVLPELDTLPDYEDMYYRYYINRCFFVTESMLLVVIYDEDTYSAEKERLDDAYVFLDHTIVADWSDEVEYLLPENEFSINSFSFRVVGDDETDYPKSFGMIGTSDEQLSIAYLYFYDFDLDYISDEGENEPMKNFVQQYFKYKW